MKSAVRPPLKRRSLLGIILVFVATRSSASCHSWRRRASADEVNVDDYPYRIAGNVKLNSVPLEGVLMQVSGNGYDVEVETDADGKWAVGVPEKATYTVTLVESSLPEGIAVVDPDGIDDTPNVKEATIGAIGPRDDELLHRPW